MAVSDCFGVAFVKCAYFFFLFFFLLLTIADYVKYLLMLVFDAMIKIIRPFTCRSGISETFTRIMFSK